MTPVQQRNLILALAAVGFLIVVIATGIALTRSQRDIQITAPAETTSSPTGFSFFELDQTTVLTRDLRKSLAQLLGSDAIAHATPIDLTVINRQFTQTHLPVLDELNRRLNPPMGERKEHDTTRLTYHRAQRHDMPFRYIELVFSNTTGRPLYFVINPSENFENNIATLKAKHGAPRMVSTSAQAPPVHIWEREGGILVATAFPRRSGRQSQELHIFFIENLKEFVKSEHRSLSEKKGNTRNAGRRAF